MYSCSCKNKEETSVVRTVQTGLNKAVKRGPLLETHQDCTKNDSAELVPF